MGWVILHLINTDWCKRYNFYKFVYFSLVFLWQTKIFLRVKQFYGPSQMIFLSCCLQFCFFLFVMTKRYFLGKVKKYKKTYSWFVLFLKGILRYWWTQKKNLDTLVLWLFSKFLRIAIFTGKNGDHLILNECSLGFWGHVYFSYFIFVLSLFMYYTIYFYWYK